MKPTKITWLAGLLLSGALVLPVADSAAKPAPKAPQKGSTKAAKGTIQAKEARAKVIPLPRPRPDRLGGVDKPVGRFAVSSAATSTTTSDALPDTSSSATSRILSAPVASASPPASPLDLSTVKRALDLIRRGKADEATALKTSVNDPGAAKLIEWAVLRSDRGEGKSFERYAAFVNANPGWPSVGMLRRRAEGALWDDSAPPGKVRAFFGESKPASAKGKFALARAMIAQGDRAGAQHVVRDAWRNDNFGPDTESYAQEEFGELLTTADHKARMDRRLYADDSDALRLAKRLGPTALAVAKARLAVNAKADNSKALLDALPAEVRSDPVYLLSRIQVLRREDKITEAGQLMASAPRDPAVILDTDEWWIERRLTARKLLDIGDAKLAYRITSEAAAPSKDNYRAEHHFTAGWIALRFLNDPHTAMGHFARIAHGNDNPISKARGAYWQGRAAEALGRPAEARQHYEEGSRYPTAYYGQLARAKLGHTEIGLREPPRPAFAGRNDLVRAVEILYALGERDLIIPMMADVADRTQDGGTLRALADLTARYNDARGMLLLGKGALARGLPFDHYAFPTLGVPEYTPVGPAVEPSVVYSIVRQESQFNPKTVSSANALGLMQVTPDAGRYVAKKYSVAFDQKRLLHDSVYNTQMGSAELGGVIQDYRGSYILAFAAYNAGRGRVKEWVERYGDPRDAKIDPVDWVERIPFGETRNYVQRALENVQVYRTRFGGGSRLLIEADLRRGSVTN
jgi:soluble lytic murein transglycosylase